MLVKTRRKLSRLAEDLRSNGLQVWLDEWEITVGDSITAKIQEGLDQSDYLAVWVTRNSISSKWVTREWQTKLSDEVNKGNIFVLPLLAEDCSLPSLLQDQMLCRF